MPKKEKVIGYVDGFNLYFGMLEAGLDHCKWPDLGNLVKSLLKPHQELVAVKYFTSRVSNAPISKKDKLHILKPLKHLVSKFTMVITRHPQLIVEDADISGQPIMKR